MGRRRRSSRLGALFEDAARAEANVATGTAVPVSRSLLDVFRLHGSESSAALLLLLALVCVLPVAGVGTVVGFAIIAIAVRWHRPAGFDHLSQRLERIALSDVWYRRCLRALAWIYQCAGRLLRTRWIALRRRSASQWWGAWIALMGALILLPLPLGNVLPALSLVLLSLGWIFRDGMALIGSAIVGMGAVAFAVLMGDLLLAGADRVLSWLAGSM
jgi:hypothetical protein